ncbi:MAG: radical SAM protein [Theionarchaea archaeon]|nr:radical SAM protein [Theionarchaea archaeon]MBU7037896.1 radical SAM protein [Theionarchaea archaeon]
MKDVSGISQLEERGVRRVDQLENSFTFQYQITENCNLHCTHCYQDESITYQATTEQLIAMLDKFLTAVEKWHALPRVPLSGGEPLVSPSVWPLLDHLQAYSQNHPVSGAVLTNGTLVDRSVAETLATYDVLRFVQVSLDGVRAETHDRVRGRGAFEKTLQGIGCLQEAGIPFHIHLVVHKNNYQDAYEITDLAEQLGAEYVLVTRLVPFGRGKQMNDMLLTSQEVKSLYSWLGNITDSAFEKAVNQEKAVFVNRLRCDWPVVCTGTCLDSMFSLVNKNGNHCQVGKKYIAVMPDGTCYACRRMPVVVGNLLTQSFEEMWNHSFLWKMRKKYAHMKGKCSKCPFNTDTRLNFTCMGGASCISYGAYGDPFMPDPQCSFDPEQDAQNVLERVDNIYTEYREGRRAHGNT